LVLELKNDFIIYFQGIGILVGYNYALPYYIGNSLSNSRLYCKIICENDLVSFFLGGYRYRTNKVKQLLLPHKNVRYKEYPSKTLIAFISKYLARKRTLLHINDVKAKYIKILLKSKAPIVLTIHGYPSKTYPGKDILDNVDAVIAPYDYEGYLLHKIYGIKPKIIHHGIDPTIFNTKTDPNKAKKILGIRTNGKIITWIARFDESKKPWLFLKAVTKLLEERQDITVIMYTRAVNKCLYYTLYKHINNLRKRFKKRFLFKIRWIPYIKMPLIYRASDIYVSTGIGGIDLIEAMASNSIVVAEDNPISREILGDTGIYYKENDASSLIESLHYALSNERNKFEKKQKVQIYKYKGLWNLAAKEYINQYINILNNT